MEHPEAAVAEEEVAEATSPAPDSVLDTSELQLVEETADDVDQAEAETELSDEPRSPDFEQVTLDSEPEDEVQEPTDPLTALAAAQELSTATPVVPQGSVGGQSPPRALQQVSAPANMDSPRSRKRKAISRTHTMCEGR